METLTPDQPYEAPTVSDLQEEGPCSVCAMIVISGTDWWASPTSSRTTNRLSSTTSRRATPRAWRRSSSRRRRT